MVRNGNLLLGVLLSISVGGGTDASLKARTYGMHVESLLERKTDPTLKLREFEITSIEQSVLTAIACSKGASACGENRHCADQGNIDPLVSRAFTYSEHSRLRRPGLEFLPTEVRLLRLKGGFMESRKNATSVIRTESGEISMLHFMERISILNDTVNMTWDEQMECLREWRLNDTGSGGRRLSLDQVMKMIEQERNLISLSQSTWWKRPLLQQWQPAPSPEPDLLEKEKLLKQNTWWRSPTRQQAPSPEPDFSEIETFDSAEVREEKQWLRLERHWPDEPWESSGTDVQEVQECESCWDTRQDVETNEIQVVEERSPAGPAALDSFLNSTHARLCVLDSIRMDTLPEPLSHQGQSSHRDSVVFLPVKFCANILIRVCGVCKAHQRL